MKRHVEVGGLVPNVLLILIGNNIYFACVGTRRSQFWQFADIKKIRCLHYVTFNLSIMGYSSQIVYISFIDKVSYALSFSRNVFLRHIHRFIKVSWFFHSKLENIYHSHPPQIRLFDFLRCRPKLARTGLWNPPLKWRLIYFPHFVSFSPRMNTPNVNFLEGQKEAINVSSE